MSSGGEISMTETYHGDWSPVTGDKPGVRVVDDPYHQRYPVATEAVIQAVKAKRVEVRPSK